MKINDYELNVSEDFLDDIFAHKTRIVELVNKDFSGYKNLTEGNKKALEHLVAAAKIFDEVAMEQDHELNLSMKKALEDVAVSSTHAAKALRLFMSFHGVEGHNGIDIKPIEIFKGIKGSKGRNFYPSDLDVEEFHKIIADMINEGKIDEVRRILSVRTMVRRHGKELKAIDYTEYFSDAFSKAANELEVAAHYTTDKDFKEYLEWQAQALLQNNEDMDMLADKHWAVLQNDNQLEFTLGRESYDDELTATIYDNPELMTLINEHQIEVNPKDMLGVRVGIINREGTELILKFKEHMPELAKLMPYSDSYHQSISADEELKQTMVDVDLVALTGDYAQCRGAITTAQNLPNNDKLSIKTGGGRRNAYHRQVRKSVDAERNRKLLEKLVAPELHKYFDLEADHLFVIGHENGHSLGPDNEYQRALGLHRSTVEEEKADTVSIAFMPEYVKAGIIDEETLKKIYVTWVVYRLFLKAQPLEAHRVGELIHFNYLLDNGAFYFDTDNKLHINFDNFHDVIYAMLKETIEVQLSKSSEKAKAFIDKYTNWGKHSQYIAEVQKELGVKNYIEIKGYF